MQKWIILLVRGGRIASIELTAENLAELKKRMYLSLVSVNADGTRYYEVLGMKS